MSSTTIAAPLYVQFANQIKAQIKALGLPEPTTAATPTGFPENEGYFFVEWGTHGQAPALIVPKSKTRMGNLHSHVDLSGIPGHIALPKRNGKVVCHFEPDASKVSKALASFIGSSKRPTAAPVRRLAPTLTATNGVASQAPQGPTAADLELASWGQFSATPSAPAGYSDDEAEEALQALNA